MSMSETRKEKLNKLYDMISLHDLDRASISKHGIVTVSALIKTDLLKVEGLLEREILSLTTYNKIKTLTIYCGLYNPAPDGLLESDPDGWEDITLQDLSGLLKLTQSPSSRNGPDGARAIREGGLEMPSRVMEWKEDENVLPISKPVMVRGNNNLSATAPEWTLTDGYVVSTKCGELLATAPPYSVNKKQRLDSGGETSGSNDDASEEIPRRILDYRGNASTLIPEASAKDDIKVESPRINQRSRAVAKGKNTSGYEEYIKQVPKHERRMNSMAHPMTPDHTLDMPNRRWLGNIKAWRKALHKFDPPDLADNKPEEEKPIQILQTYKHDSILANAAGDGQTKISQENTSKMNYAELARNREAFLQQRNNEPIPPPEEDRTTQTRNEDDEASWRIQFGALKLFKDSQGHCRVPRTHAAKCKLGGWVKKQRKLYKSSALAEDRVRALDEIGFVWTVAKYTS